MDSSFYVVGALAVVVLLAGQVLGSVVSCVLKSWRKVTNSTQ